MQLHDFNLVKMLRLGTRRLTRIVTQPVYALYRKVVKALNPTGVMNQAMGDIRTGFRKLVTTHPSSLKDYFPVGRHYIAKILALVVLLLALILPVAYLKLLHPFIVSKFLTKDVYINTSMLNGYTGKVRIKSKLDDSVIYLGKVADGRVTGEGSLFDKDGNLVYRGAFVNEMYEGEGEAFYMNGKTWYKGSFAANKYEGKGVLYDEEGTIIYEGEFANGLYEGAGTEYYPNGQPQYVGTFSIGKYSGTGTVYTETGGTLYEGGFLNGKAEGAGTLYANGLVESEGSFVNGRLTGQGKLYEGGALLYEGEMLEGKMHGKGMTYAGDAVMYDGEFADNAYSGSGRLYDPTTRQLLYDGEFTAGKFTGMGRYFDVRNGRMIYEGSFFEGVYDGEGKLFEPETQAPVYEGGFHLGRLEGQGILYDVQSGIPIYEGAFRNGLFDGEGKEYNKLNGSILYEGGYLNGKFNNYGMLYNPVNGTIIQAGIYREGELATPMMEGLPSELTESFGVIPALRSEPDPVDPAHMDADTAGLPDVTKSPVTGGDDLPGGKSLKGDKVVPGESTEMELFLAEVRNEIPAIVLPNIATGLDSADTDGTVSGHAGADASANGAGGLVGQPEETVRASYAMEPMEWDITGARLLIYDAPAAGLGQTIQLGSDGAVRQVDVWNSRAVEGIAVGMTRDEINAVMGEPEASLTQETGEARMISISQSNRFHGRITNLSAQSQIDTSAYHTAGGAVRVIYSRQGECLLIEMVAA